MGTNGDNGHTWTDAVNQSVRAIVTLGLLIGFVALAWVKEIDSGLFTNVFSIVIAFWFAQRTPSSKDAPSGGTAAPGSTTVTTPPPTTVTVTSDTPKP